MLEEKHLHNIIGGGPYSSIYKYYGEEQINSFYLSNDMVNKCNDGTKTLQERRNELNNMYEYFFSKYSHEEEILSKPLIEMMKPKITKDIWVNFWLREEKFID